MKTTHKTRRMLAFMERVCPEPYVKWPLTREENALRAFTEAEERRLWMPILDELDAQKQADILAVTLLARRLWSARGLTWPREQS